MSTFKIAGEEYKPGQYKRRPSVAGSYLGLGIPGGESVPGSTASRMSNYDKDKDFELKSSLKKTTTVTVVSKEAVPRQSVSFFGATGTSTTTTQKFMVTKLIRQSSAAGLTAFRLKFRTGILRLVQRMEKQMWIKANGGGTKRAKIRAVAKYAVMAQGKGFKGDSKSLSRFRFAFRTAIMKLIDRMERQLEGQIVKKLT